MTAEWARADADFATRVQHLKGVVAGGYNSSYTLTAATVQDDAAEDDLFGGSDADWFLLGVAVDADNDAGAGDHVTTL